jgi:hypothetical protein
VVPSPAKSLSSVVATTYSILNTESSNLTCTQRLSMEKSKTRRFHRWTALVTDHAIWTSGYARQAAGLFNAGMLELERGDDFLRIGQINRP